MNKILICDDEKDIVSALKIYLEAEGFETVSAYNGAEAIEKLKKEQCDLVLMDIMMPVMDGISAMVEIRDICNVPIILLTAKSEDTDKILGLNVGADDYVTKPFNPLELIARVKAQLRRYTRLGSAEPSGVIRVGEVFSPKDIYKTIRNESPYGAEGTVAVHIRHLREKIEIDPASPTYLKVVWGQGYKIEEGK